jgi:hypothetical protein
MRQNRPRLRHWILAAIAMSLVARFLRKRQARRAAA